MPDIEAGRLLDAWRAARSVVPVTGRRPVLITSEDVILDGEDRSDFDDLNLAARKINPWVPPWRVITDDPPIPATELYGHLRGFPTDLVEAASAQLSLPTTGPVLGRWIYERLLADPTIAAPLQAQVDAVIGTRYWFGPSSVRLVLLPTPLPWLAPCWLDYWGTDDSAWLSAVQWQWHHRWGAELVGSWGHDAPVVAGEMVIFDTGTGSTVFPALLGRITAGRRLAREATTGEPGAVRHARRGGRRPHRPAAAAATGPTGAPAHRRAARAGAVPADLGPRTSDLGPRTSDLPGRGSTSWPPGSK